MSELGKRQAKIIFDNPADSDAFEAGGHQRSANTLANAIEQLSDRDGAIGLEGEWGSGKSTVIKLAEKILQESGKKDRKYCVFTFDLWAHQADDFRRAFLEAFVSWLENNGHLQQKDAKDARDTIRDRTKTIKYDNSRHYNILGLFFILIAPLLPLAYAWLSPFAFNSNISIPPVLGLDPPKLVLLIFMLLYLTFFLRLFTKFFEFRRGPSKWSWSIKWLGKKSFSEVASKAISIFTRDVEKEEITQNIRETDPTTIEFHNVFRKQLSKVQESQNRIILVLDNIDRLPKSSVSNIWSEVRSLFAIGTSENGVTNSWVTAVVPYDKPYIVSALTNNPETSDNNSSEVEVEFITKTFNRIIRVSPPVATDWKKFLQQSVDYAFDPNLDEQTSFRLFKLLDHYFQKNLKPPTPRLIINFVNEISALWEQWGNDIPTESMALFVIHRSQIEKNPTALPNFELTSSRYNHIAEVENWPRDFAALAFNVPIDIANQVLLNQPIARALSSGDTNDILEISQSAGFQEILPDVLEERLVTLAKESAEVFSNASKNINGLNLKGELNRSIWSQFDRAIDYLVKIKLSEKETLAGLFVIVKKQENSIAIGTAKKLVRKISESEALKEERTFEEGQDWLNVIYDLGETIVDKGAKGDILNHFFMDIEIPLNAEFCLGVAHACEQKKNIEFKDLSLKTPKKDIQEAFSQYIEVSPKKFEETLDQIDHLLDDSVKASYLDKISTRLKTTEITDEDSRKALLEAVTKLYHKAPKSEKAKSILGSLISDGTLLWHGHTAGKKGNHESEAIALWLIITQTNSLSLPTFPDTHPQLGNMTSTRDWYTQTFSASDINQVQVNKLAQYVSIYKGFSKWATYAIEEKFDQNFLKEIFRTVVKMNIFQNLNIVQTVYDYPSIKEILGEQSIAGFLQKYQGWSHSFEKSFSDDKIEKIPSEFILDVARLDSNSPLNLILNNIDSYLKNLSQDDWEDAFSKEDDRVRLLQSRRITANLTLPADTYRPALMSHAIKVLQGELKTEKFTSNWNEVLNGLKPANRSLLAKDIFNNLSKITIDIRGVEHFIEIYYELAKEMPYTEDETGLALDQFFSKLVYSEKESVRRFLMDTSNKIQACLENASESSKNGFEEAIESLEQKDEVISQEWAAKLRNIFGLERKPSPSEQSSVEE